MHPTNSHVNKDIGLICTKANFAYKKTTLKKYVTTFICYKYLKILRVVPEPRLFLFYQMPFRIWSYTWCITLQIIGLLGWTYSDWKKVPESIQEGTVAALWGTNDLLYLASQELVVRWHNCKYKFCHGTYPKRLGRG